SRFLLPTFLCGRQRKVGAAPHRGNANRPLTQQGKAKEPDPHRGNANTANRPLTKQGKAKEPDQQQRPPNRPKP
ncbi:MAG: hypothetical protein DI523_38045, partial [Paraburkholderia fungorum]